MVLAELARGSSTEEIGMTLEVSPHTVRTHVKNLMRKLGARTRAHAVAIALLEHAIEIRP
jgi:DNA-binding CsgD family transcriptional regulator